MSSNRQIIARYFQMFAYFPILFFLKSLFDFEIIGKENLLNFKNKPVIFAGNHNNREFDGFLVGVAVENSSKTLGIDSFLPIKPLVYKDYFKWNRFSFPMPFPFSVLASIWLKINCIPIKNRHKKEYENVSLESILSSAILSLRNGERLLIFPEGTTGGDDKLRKAKRGIACLHKETGVAIVPMGLKGTYKMFSLKNLLKPREEKKVVVTFGKPIYSLWEEGEEKDLRKGADRVLEEIKKLI